jgi:hypothetical protein
MVLAKNISPEAAQTGGLQIREQTAIGTAITRFIGMNVTRRSDELPLSRGQHCRLAVALW